MFGIEIRTAFMVLMLLAQHCFGDPTTSQQNHTSHSTEQPINSVSLKSSTDSTSHGSKSMHQPSSVPSAANHLNQLVSDDVQFDDFTQIVDLSDILVIFNVKELAAMWPKVQHDVRTECQHDMIEYFRGLAKQKVWAQKMNDASGRYSSGLFYGNNFWMGSLTLCESIYKPPSDITPVVVVPADSAPKAKDAISFNDYSPTETVHENPPFLPGFFVIKARINETQILRHARTIRTGVCLPSSCSLDDVEHMVFSSQRPMSTRHIEIDSVQSPTEDPYDFRSDRTFIILSIVTCIVFTLMAVATLYELYLTNLAKKALKNKRRTKDDATDSSSGIGCTTYDLTGAVPNKNELSIGIVIPRGMNNNNSDENLAEESINVEEIKLSVWSELLLSFSVITNFKAICDQSVGNDTIPSIHGLRAISMAWVILGHTCIIVFKYADNMELRKEVEKNFWFQTISNGTYSVDTFFFISGFLVSYIYFRTNANGKLKKLSQGVSEWTASIFHFFGLIGYRFVRLTAPYMYVLFLVEVIMKYFHHHSVFETPASDHENCPNYWWRNILYINTLFPVEQMCMLWSWYLADDTQFFIVGAVILIIAVRQIKIASSMLICLVISSWAVTGSIAYQNNHVPNADDPFALFDKIYDKPWTRLGPYMVGMCVGYFLYKNNERNPSGKIQMSRTTLVFGWFSASFCLLWIIYGLYHVQLSPAGSAAYTALSHTAWALSLAWIVIACSSGNGGYVNRLLSAPVIYPFSRVTYCAYLVHPIAIRFISLNSDATLHLGSDSMINVFFGHLVLSFLLAFIVSLSFEAPVVTMLKILTPNRKKILVESRD